MHIRKRREIGNKKQSYLLSITSFRVPNLPYIQVPRTLKIRIFRISKDEARNPRIESEASVKELKLYQYHKSLSVLPF